jgi:flagellar biosynthesis repressor protein FlbT
MTRSLLFRLKAGDRLFVNGAVMRFDRKVSVEFLNDVTFLLENHVMQPEEASTPLRQLYFIIQLGLIEPNRRGADWPIVDQVLVDTLAAFEDRDVLEALYGVRRLLEAGRYFEALKLLRDQFAAEEAILAGGVAAGLPKPMPQIALGGASWK